MCLDWSPSEQRPKQAVVNTEMKIRITREAGNFGAGK